MVGNASRIAVAVMSIGIGMAACSRNMAATTDAAPAVKPLSAPVANVPSQVETLSTERMVSGLPNFSPLVDRYGPAVVNVEVVEKNQRGLPEQHPGTSPSDPLFDFFKRQQQQPSRGEGSGFIVTPDGYIMTNAHVVQDAETVTVRTTDRREYSAKVIGVDEPTDVAVIKIEAKDLPTVKLGDPSKLKPGEWVIAIGSPFGFENSVTAGIVSATSRAMGATYASFIQTDVAVNPGNSGGPLFNLEGEVVGINSQIYTRTGGFMGLSFAVPIDIANNVREQLVSTGKVARSRIGVNIGEVSASLAEGFGLDRPRGALINGTLEGSPGEQAGLQPGDVILKVNGTPIEKSQQVPAEISKQRPGSNVKLEVWREGKLEQFTVRPEAMQDEESAVRKVNFRESNEQRETGKLGLAIREISPSEKARLKLEGSLVVEAVEGAAERAGIEPRDIILGVGSKKVSTVKALQEATKKGRKVVPLLIQRGEQQFFLPVPVG